MIIQIRWIVSVPQTPRLSEAGSPEDRARQDGRREGASLMEEERRGIAGHENLAYLFIYVFIYGGCSSVS
jgi:hypothetical protein